MNRIEDINKIVKYSTRFVQEVESYNSLNQYHINIHAESFLIPLLNEVFGLSLENLNYTQKKNYPAIDLADFENRVAFQVTSTSSIEKIKDTLKKFFNYELHKQFDVLYFYMLTAKKEKYNDDKLGDIVPKDFIFSTSDHIFDNKGILKKIDGISSSMKITHIARLYQHEFSDVQIEDRESKYKGGYLNSDSEEISPNLLSISIPKTLYKVQLNIDEDKLTDRLNQYFVSMGRRRVKKFRIEKLIKRELADYHAYNKDWVVFENWLYTFRDLHARHEPLKFVVDEGTITSLDSQDFYELSDDHARVVKHLVRKTFSEFCRTKGLEWVDQKQLYRFANDRRNPGEKEIRWKGKKEAKRRVITEMRSKKDDHVICYRSLAFKCSFLNIDREWFAIINPTWSFTNPGGYYTSRFEPTYMSGLKKLENNQSVFNAFRVIEYHLTYSDLFTKQYPFLKINSSMSLSITPRLEEERWKPPKKESKIDVDENVELSIGYELFDDSFFE